ncbi:apolipoprotein N-acyltransferase [Halioxenophilus aromaticivorans]|uniref:Apolipoprotein N-acyltransferase n=1 Tax=Halioxenophilus aromaticivorans TaxID=1306992 RepID=A0AAV3U3U7_9ALTE
MASGISVPPGDNAGSLDIEPEHSTQGPTRPTPLPVFALPYWLWLVINLAAGAITPLALAPFNWWPLAVLGLGLFQLSLSQLSRGYFGQAFSFGLGFFGVGASWVFVSISQYGSSSTPLALVLTGLFVAGLALVLALPYLLFARLRGRSWLTTLIITGPLFWVFGEWLRGWLLTGFPWLYLGYSQLNTWLAGFAPVGGVLLVSLMLAITAATVPAVVITFIGKQWLKGGICLAATVAFWLTGDAYNQQLWTKPISEQPITVGLVQPNISQAQKWLPENRRPTLDLLATMSEPLWAEADWVLWPEAALPTLYEYAQPFIDEISNTAAKNNSTLITGVLYRSPGKPEIYNSIIARGLGQGNYLKTRLVPFGEYVPLEHWLRGTLDFFNLPTSIIAAGHGQQRGLQAGVHRISTSICYEVVYPALVAQNALGSDVLLTISNDGWFGDSIGPLQHMQMAQMRAKETQRYLIRGTNNGISALVDHRGKIVASMPQFERSTLVGTVFPRQGETPFMRFQNHLIEMILGFGLLALLVQNQRRRRAQSTSA